MYINEKFEAVERGVKAKTYDNRQLSDDDKDSNEQDSGDHDAVVQKIRSDENDIDSDDDDGQFYDGDAREKEGEEENICNFYRPQDLVEFSENGRDEPVL